MNRLDSWWMMVWWLENWSTVQITCIARKLLQQGTRILFHWLGVTRVQSSTIECTNISEARLKLLISGTDNNCLWLCSLVHLEYSASYLISCRDSGKPTETNLHVHNYLVRLSAQPLNKRNCFAGSQKIGPLLYSTEGSVITKKNADW